MYITIICIVVYFFFTGMLFELHQDTFEKRRQSKLQLQAESHTIARASIYSFRKYHIKL